MLELPLSPAPTGFGSRLSRSLIRLVAERAWARPDAIRLELGEPGVPTPEHIVEAAFAAARNGATTYSSSAGIAPLRAALAARGNAADGYDVDPSEIVVGAGGVQVLFAALATLVRAGDEVLVPDPTWPGYRMMCEPLGARAVGYRLPAAHGYQPDPDELASLVTERTRVLVLNSPSNPLGVVHEPEVTSALLEIAAARDLWVVADECYDELVYDGEFVSVGELARERHRDRTVLAYSFSKAHAMTGWRVGYAVLPPQLAGLVEAAQETLVSCVNGPAQHAALAALSGPQDHVAQLRDTFRRRRDLVCATLDQAGVDHIVNKINAA